MKLNLDHRCDDKPEHIHISYDMYNEYGFCNNGWIVEGYEDGLRGYDEQFYTKVMIGFPITYCPFCGEKLPDYSNGSNR